MDKQQKKVRRLQTAMWMAVIVVQLCAVTRMKVSAAGPEAGNEPVQEAAGAEEMSLSGGSFLQADSSLVVKSPAVLERELLAKPDESRDEDGQSWRLVRWETTPVQFPGYQEEIRQTEAYLQVEDPSELPDRMEVTAEWDGQTVTVDCEKVQQKKTGEVWVDGFRLPVTFHGYHADYYELGNFRIPHDEDRPRLEGSEALLLEMAGLAPSARRIETIVWDGPAYTAEDGELCRDALATGQKLVADYEVTYAGTAIFPERTGWQTVAVYEPVTVEVTVEETTAPSPPEAVIRDAPVPLWQKITRTLLVTVSAGSILAIIGLAVFGIFCLIKRRQV